MHLCVLRAHACVCLCTQLCLCVWRVSVKVKGPIQASSSLLGLQLPRRDRVSHWSWSLLIALDWLAGKPEGAPTLYLPSTRIADACCRVLCSWVFTWVLGIWTQVLRLAQQAPCWLNHLPGFTSPTFSLWSLTLHDGGNRKLTLPASSQWVPERQVLFSFLCLAELTNLTFPMKTQAEAKLLNAKEVVTLAGNRMDLAGFYFEW